jgi:WD40 repeat protein
VASAGSGNGVAKTGAGGVGTGAVLRFHGNAAAVTCLEEGAEADPFFFTGSADARIMVWDARTAKLPMWTLEGHEDTVVSVRAFGPVAVSAGLDGRVCEWDVSTGSLLRFHHCPAPIICADASQSGGTGRFVVATWMQTLHGWTYDATTGSSTTPGARAAALLGASASRGN